MRWIFAALLALMGCAQAAEPLTKPADGAVRVATYNVHYIILSKATGSWSVGDWERRKGPLDLAFKAINADVVGFQEMESFAHGSDGSVNLARDWLAEQNPDWGVAASGDWRVFPSTQPIFYRKARLSLKDQGWFFFSETPDVIYSRTFNGSYPAFASWAQFEERKSGKQFRVVNFHFDYSSGSNQRRSAMLIRDRTAPWIEAGERVFVIGDINDDWDSVPAQVMGKAGVQFLPVEGSTYHWNRGLNLTSPVDHIGYSSGVRPVSGPVVVRRKFDGEWPTDHYPVLADFVLE
jgi:endonuclease/exonuclease/phosphatase family metal-dependent hydrolase